MLVNVYHFVFESIADAYCCETASKLANLRSRNNFLRPFFELSAGSRSQSNSDAKNRLNFIEFTPL